jgi:hypothetical protein
MHILLIHQAFASLDEPGGTRHHELARFLAGRGHKVTIITSPVSYLTGAALTPSPFFRAAGEGSEVRVIRACINHLSTAFSHFSRSWPPRFSQVWV